MYFPHKRRALFTKLSAPPALQIVALSLLETGPDRLDSFEGSVHIFLTVLCDSYQV